MTAATEELRAQGAPPGTWREKALKLHKDGQQEDCVKVLEESMDVFKEPERLGDIADAAHDKQDTMQMLISAYLMQFLKQAQESRTVVTEESLRVPLTRASNLLEQVSAIAGDEAPSGPMAVDLFTNRGFHALTQYKMRHSSGASHELTRANTFFNSALKLDATAPRAILGKASVFMHWKEWEKALGLLRQIIQRRPRQDMMKEIKFAMANCFCGMERFAQMRSALMGVLEVDPDDVETLCALAQLDAFTNDENDTTDFLEKAWTIDHSNPVVALRAAHSAFLVGVEMPAEDRLQPGGPWSAARDMLQQVLDGKTSWENTSEAHYQMARLKHAQDLFQEAHDEYVKCRQIAPEHSACLHGFAQTCLELGQFQDAITALETMQKKHPSNPAVLRLLTFAYIQTGHREVVATAQALCALKEVDEDVEAWSMLAEAHEQRYAAGDEAAIKAANDAYKHVAKLLEAGTGQDLASPQMWNNLGTLRGLEGDAEAASKAYAKSMSLIEESKTKKQDAEESKDLHVTELTVRFNRAWLAESVDQPDNLQATSDLLKLREEVSWYADSTLSLGTKWLNIGDFDRAAETYGEASKQNPVLAAVMQAHVFKKQGEFFKALQVTEKAVDQASTKESHYVHVYFGNLYFEFSQEPTFKHEKDKYLGRALWHFMEAFKKAKDSHYAAVGIGMVFAQRGQLEFAKRTFQSVLQHTRVGAVADDDPGVYVNLGHTYVAFGGTEARKAIALYEKARKLRPNDVAIRLYLARAHFELKEFERCVGILSDALSFWPEDVTLRFNLAVCLESWGKLLVSEEKKTNRVVGMESGKDKMERAVGVLTSAGSHFSHIKKRWAVMSTEDKKAAAKSSPNPMKFMEELKRAQQHEEYCQDITEWAQEELVSLQQKRDVLNFKMSEIAAMKKRGQDAVDAEEEKEAEEAAEYKRVLENRALDLMEKEAVDVNMPKNIGLMQDKTPAQPKRSKDVSGAATEHVQKRGGKPKAITDGAERSKGSKKLSKHERKELKRQKKRERKAKKKAKRAGDASSGEEQADPDVPTRSIPTHEEEKAPDAAEQAGVEPLLPVDQAKGMDSEPEGDSAMEGGGDEDDEARKARKAAKKAESRKRKDLKRKQKQEKKAAKEAKRARKDAGGDDGDGAADKLEAELFGSDNE